MSARGVAYLLDTNVVSELVRPAPSPRVVEWVERRSRLDLYLSVLTIGEIGQGVAAMADGARRERLAQWVAHDLPRQFVGRLLDVTVDVARRWGELNGAARRSGRPLPTVDGLLLATADLHGLTVVTRNVRDIGGRGVEIVDPWADDQG